MILVVGATGALGGMVTRDLLSSGHAVRVLVRAGSDYTSLVEMGAEPVMGDLRNPESLQRACVGVQTVITTANSANRTAPDTVETVDRAGNRALIDAAAEAGVDHFVLVSVLGASDASPVEFLRAKAATEAHLRASGLTWTILQPNLFMEVWIGVLVALPLGHNRPVTLIGRGDHRHAMISRRDVAAFTVAAATNPAARNTTLVLGGPETRTWTQIVELAEWVLGRPVPLRYLPVGQALPGVPEVVSQLAAAFETYETVIDTTHTAASYGIRLTHAEECLSEMLRPIEA